MYDLVKFEGRINKLEIHEGTLNTLANTGDNQITSSAILSSVAESVSLGAQTVFLASQSRLHIQSVVMEIDGKICIGKFHRALIVENEYVICVVRRLEKNLYELYSVLSPKTGLLHMQVGMGGGVKKSYSSAIKGARVWYLLGMVILTIIILISGDFDKETLLSWGGIFILFYFVLLFIVKNTFKSLKHFSEKSEEIFKIYGFDDPEEIFLLSGRQYSDDYKILLESVYEYRKVIEKDPYPENYIEQKERNV
ncbi:putative type VI secretion system effector [Acinetobacter haemolyticus]|uniref:putative type VI secretion system effector n=1 Tax=Acinetobacter haemolyticus TaxID=29430 RepID=UPI002A6AE9E8|nr:putative type VI secretion system effector [Acinetobacter haemolyticus]WPO66430.1 putative type VI secretion system effector [Acinetobacter haemolyticus]